MSDKRCDKCVNYAEEHGGPVFEGLVTNAYAWERIITVRTGIDMPSEGCRIEMRIVQGPEGEG